MRLPASAVCVVRFCRQCHAVYCTRNPTVCSGRRTGTSTCSRTSLPMPTHLLRRL